MSGCLDNMQIPQVEVGEKRNKYASILSGILVSYIDIKRQALKEKIWYRFVHIQRIIIPLQFFSGWWFAIDAAAVHPEKTELKDVFQICGVFGTISFFM